jgi:ATP-binding cassette subfamily F protein 3
MEVAPSDTSLTDIRGLLGQFMFKGDDADKKIRVLSGGEKALVADSYLISLNHFNLVSLAHAHISNNSSVLCVCVKTAAFRFAR